MTRKRQPYKTYTKEFKLEAVRLMKESDKPSAEIAAELGVRRNQLQAGIPINTVSLPLSTILQVININSGRTRTQRGWR